MFPLTVKEICWAANPAECGGMSRVEANEFIIMGMK
jgi:hypothetical protein